MTREERIAREMQECKIPPAAAQDEAEAASSRFAPAIPHVDLASFAQLSSDVQPRSTPKTLVTRSSQPVSNTMHYAPFPENDDRDACPNVSRDVLTSGDLSAEVSRLQDEVPLCRQRIESYPSEIQGMRVVMDRHERFRFELAAGFEAEKKRPSWTGDGLLSVWTEEETSASRSTTAATGKLHRAIKELEENVLSCFENWRQQGTLQA